VCVVIARLVATVRGKGFNQRRAPLDEDMIAYWRCQQWFDDGQVGRFAAICAGEEACTAGEQGCVLSCGMLCG